MILRRRFCFCGGLKARDVTRSHVGFANTLSEKIRFHGKKNQLPHSINYLHVWSELQDLFEFFNFQLPDDDVDDDDDDRDVDSDNDDEH